MVYTKKTPALLIIGLLLLAFWFAVNGGYMDGVIKYLNTTRAKNEMIQFSLYFGVAGVVVGLWN
ncbi:MAG: hypothetical protein FJX42_12695, partial [Alphaproteobacteria bacterium]|nr:hypothetical protein [Alphaproteobacteria bacterium]